MGKRTRMQPDARKAMILQAAIEAAKSHGYQNVTRDDIANRAGVSMGLVTKYYGTMNQLRRAIMRAAVVEEIGPVIAQGLVFNDPQAQKAPEHVKRKALSDVG